MRRLLNGYIDTFYVLGNEDGKAFVNHNTKSAILITDPMRAIKFDSKEEASSYNEQNKNNYKEKLIVHQIRVTVELIWF